MKLWKRASGVRKDRTSLLRANLTSRSMLRNPSIETAVIKATSHDESLVDYRATQHVFTWVRISDECLYRVLWVLFRRMKRTHNWAVVLKGLMLLHGVFTCKVPGIQQIGQLPSDLLNLKENLKEKRGNVNAFIHGYYAFLDQKSAFISLHSQEQIKRTLGDETNEEQKRMLMIQDLIWLQRLQGLLDSLLRIQPKSSQTVNVLVLEAMDCIMIEIYDIYSRISIGIGTLLMKIYPVGKNEAVIALPIVQKAKAQGEEVSMFFEFCRDIGVGNTSECPKMALIPEEVIQELKDIISGDLKLPKEEVKSVIVVTNNSISSLKSVITDYEEQKKSNPALISRPVKNNTRLHDPLPDLISL
ncbi:putative ANTH domain, ENTH domain, ANTH domain superfamily protein [Helianthus annuus]|nr:putative ANTH domain, ENTH domain, ANTH domain superfamily protein [Helianthus annuus]KAJ0617913.1 putative ANTH domain, ENTH domain, ANTH domain superfamily protein [Helianthus annuus]